MIRILQVVNRMDRAGLETMLMNYYRKMDRSKIQFDFLTHREDAGAYDEEIKKLGGKIYVAPRLYPQNYPAYFKYMKKFFSEHPEYKIIHSHIDVMSYLPLLAAKKAGISVRIAHSHSTNVDKDFKYILKQYFRRKINSVATEKYACGYEAGKYLFFDEDFEIIRNAIDIKLFSHDNEMRNKKRKELNLEGKYVIGHVGRFVSLKNQAFLVDVLEKLIKEDETAHLLLVGEGELKEQIEKKVQERGLKENVTILTKRKDMSELYQVMDVFVLPSLYEGLPLVLIEAQAAGLNCIVSNQVTQEAKISKNTFFMELDEILWKEQLLKLKNLNEVNTIYDKQYDINFAAKQLSDKYIELWNKEKEI